MPYDATPERIYSTAEATPVGGLFVRPGLEGIAPLRRYRAGPFGFIPTDAEAAAERDARLQRGLNSIFGGR